MNREIRVLDVVALTEDISDRGLLRGQLETVVESLGPDVYGVRTMYRLNRERDDYQRCRVG